MPVLLRCHFLDILFPTRFPTQVKTNIEGLLTAGHNAIRSAMPKLRDFGMSCFATSRSSSLHAMSEAASSPGYPGRRTVMEITFPEPPSWMSRELPQCPVSQDGVEDDDELAHASDDHDLGGVPAALRSQLTEIDHDINSCIRGAPAWRDLARPMA